MKTIGPWHRAVQPLPTADEHSAVQTIARLALSTLAPLQLVACERSL
jgi:hypothetical protein